MNEKRHINTTFLTEMGLLIALILLLAFTPLGYIKTLGLEITLIVVPVAVGAVVLGPTAGALLGFIFGVTSFIQCFGMSAFGAVLLGINPIGTFITCVAARTLMGWLTGLIYQGLKKVRLKDTATYIANLCCPLLNTLFFMSCIVIFFYNTEYIQGFVQALGATNPFMFVLLFVGVNGLIEAALCFIVGSAVSKALLHFVNKK